MTEPRQLKIMYLITKSNYGGAQKYTFELAAASQERGHAVVVACGGTGDSLAPPGELEARLKEANIPVRHVPGFMRDISVASDIKAFWQVYSLLRTERPDVLHISSSKAGGIGTVAARLLAVPRIIFTIHGMPADEAWRPKWQQFLIAALTWITTTLSHHVIVLTKEAALRVRSWPGQQHKVHLIHNGVSHFVLADHNTLRQELGIRNTITAIVGVGELHPNKNWSQAISVMPTLPATVHLYIIGAGEERAKLESLVTTLAVSDRVHFLGHMKDAARFLPAFNILILPSKKEGLPYVILEAGVASLPVVASDLPGIQEIIETGEHGLLTQLDSEEFSTALQMLVRDTGMQRRLGDALHARVMDHFTLKEMVEKTFHLYSTTSAVPVERTEA